MKCAIGGQRTGNIVGWYGVSTDIEDRKSAESLLAGEKRILEMLAKGDSLGEILDALCRFVEAQANGVLASVLLLDEGRLQHGGAPSLPKVYTDAIDGTVVGPSAGSCGTAAYRGEQVIVEDIATDPLWANYRELALPHSLRACWSTPILSSQGKVIATFAMYYRESRRPTKRDQEIIEQITHLAGVAIERKLTQDKLQRSEAFLAEAQHLSRTGSFGWNVSSGEIFWSEETYKIFEYDRAVKPTAELVLQRVHPEDRGLVQQTIDRVTNERTNFDLEHRLLMPDGSVKYLHVLGGALEPTSGDLEFVGAVTDVTERTRSEEALRQMQAHLAHLNRVSTMGELTASLAHEIKQPIGAAVTNAGACVLLLGHDHPDLAEAREAASEMVKDARRAADIVDRVRLLFQKRSSQLEVADVNEIVGEMVVMLQNEANRHSVTMRTDLVEGLPKVMADRVQLQQALMNLMLNGMEAMRDGSGMLSIKSQLAEDGQLLISVTDSGMGLPAENTGKIFDAFFTTKSQGTGLGLAITRSIIEAHGGRIWATANPERGAT